MKTRFSSPLFAFASRGLFGLALLALVPVVPVSLVLFLVASDDDASDSEAQDLKKKPKTKKPTRRSVFGTCVGAFCSCGHERSSRQRTSQYAATGGRERAKQAQAAQFRSEGLGICLT